MRELSAKSTQTLSQSSLLMNLVLISSQIKTDSVQLEDSYEKGKVRYVTCYDIDQIKHQLAIMAK